MKQAVILVAICTLLKEMSNAGNLLESVEPENTETSIKQSNRDTVAEYPPDKTQQKLNNYHKQTEELS